ncbi:MAG: hypothetical protein HY965_02210 [Ignavibacteriales bacterium]|nr:hypothetical protein [Ignavibacteriales bacterium]
MQPEYTGIITRETNLSELLAKNHYLILMMEHLGLNLAVQEKSVGEVCLENSINPDVFLAFANQFNGISYRPEKNFSMEDIVVIISFLQRSHKYYLEEKCPVIRNFIIEMGTVNGTASMQLIEKFFNEYVSELNTHLEYEEHTVFPYVKSLYQQLHGTTISTKDTPYSVVDYKDHHNDIKEKLTDLKNLLIKYLPEKNGRTVRRKLLFALYEFEYDIEIHSQIEDFILIPLVEAMEKQLTVHE